MTRHALGLLAALASVAPAFAANHKEDLTKYVLPKVGTEGAIPGSSLGGGNMFPGAAIPFGTVKLGIDTSVLNLDQGGISSANSGYTPRGNLTGFSMMHTSGTGGQPKYGIVSQMPLLGSLDAQGINVADNRTYLTNRTDESASVGYFRTTLETTGIKAELAAAEHSGALYYTFPSSPAVNTSSSGTSSQAHVLVDLVHALPSGGGGYIAQRYVKGSLNVAEDGSGYSGTAYYNLGWNQGEQWPIHFCANFSKPATDKNTWFYPYIQLIPHEDPVVLRPYYDITAGDNLAIGALFSWDYPEGEELELESRVGVSFLSPEKACQHVKKEVPWKQTFNQTVQAARDAWNDEILSTIVIPEENGPKNETLLSLLYTHLYGTALMPSDRTGENPLGWKSKEPYYDDWYTMWDIYRSTTPFFHLAYTNRFTKMLRGVIDIWRFDGFLPDGRSGNYNGRTQGGSNADNVLADAFVKGLSSFKHINWNDAYKAIVTDAEKVPVRNMDFNAWDGGTKEGRNALPDWHKYGYITLNYSRSISKGVEYAQNDFSAYVVAKGLGKKKDAKRYFERSQNWNKFWNPNATVDLGERGLGVHTGFFGSRNPNGTFNEVDVINCGGCTWGDLTYEGLVWEYSFNVPHDTIGVIKAMGGEEAFEKRLDASWIQGFSEGAGAANTAGTALFNPGNEPSFQTPFLYNYMKGKQYKTVETTRELINMYYNLKPSGIPGNQDAGAMATWFLWNMMGLYPVSGQPIYLISAPFFKALNLRIGTANPYQDTKKSKTYLKIRASNLTQENIYVQSVRVNGYKINRSFVWHDEIRWGGKIEFEMGPEPKKWDTGELPPSISMGSFKV